MRYEFQCSGCGEVKEFFASIHDGPPSDVKCIQCGWLMIHQLSCNFILKGDGWAGKDLKKSETAREVAREKNDAQLDEDNRSQRVVDEVMDVRRQGKKASEQLKKDKPQKIAEYREATKKGYRAKQKSYKLKTDG